MPIDPQVVGHQLAPLDYEVNPDKTILYNLGIGAGEDPDDLKYVYENAPGLLALPTFGVIPPFPALMGLLAVPGVQINLAMLLHGEQYLEVRKPVPVQGRLVSKPRISSLYDKGKGALIELEMDTEDESGEVVFFNRFGVFIRGEGGFGGEKGPEPGNEPPERDPDATIELKTAPTQAMLYRLSGDKNPLHVDPNFSAMGGFERPILHGLCSFGFAARAVLKQYCENDPARFKAIKVRFSRHVFPGETIVTEMWKVADDQIIFRCKTAERGELCLSNSAVWLNA